MVAHLADGAADELRGPEHGRRVEQRLDLAGLGILDALMQEAHDRLA